MLCPISIFVVSPQPVHSTPEEIASDPNTPALSMRVRILGWRSKLKNITPLTTRT